MTKEELIECKDHLELLKSEIEWDFDIGYQIDLDIAIEALEKQIALRANNIVCPICGGFSIIDGEYGDRFNYCYECGQRILWE